MVTIKSKNLEITEALNEFIIKKSEPLERLIGEENVSHIIIEIERETTHHRKGEVFLAAGSVSFPDKNISVQQRSDDAKKAIMEMLDEFKVEVKKYKSRIEEFIRERKRSSEKFLSQD